MTDDEEDQIIINAVVAWANVHKPTPTAADIAAAALSALRRSYAARKLYEEDNSGGQTMKTLHFKYFRHPDTKKLMSPIARWSETGMVRRG